MQVPLPWERLLWSGRSAFPGAPRARYYLTDFRLVSRVGGDVREVALHDITDTARTRSRLERLFGLSTIIVTSSGAPRPLDIRGIRRGDRLAAILDLLSGEPAAAMDLDAVRDALAWEPRGQRPPDRQAVLAVLPVAIAVLAVGIGLHGSTTIVHFPQDDPIYPDGQKRSRAEIVAFMEREVMPWARQALGPIKGGPDRITCQTCHGRDGESRGWQMPAVAALPQPELRLQGWERYGGPMDAQMRNAIYGYLAGSGKQSRAAYMREVVMPGMSRILGRPPYDFTQPYDYNRGRRAFGCYHCHRVK